MHANHHQPSVPLGAAFNDLIAPCLAQLANIKKEESSLGAELHYLRVMPVNMQHSRHSVVNALQHITQINQPHTKVKIAIIINVVYRRHYHSLMYKSKS